MTIDQPSSHVQPEKQRSQPSAIVRDILGSAAVTEAHQSHDVPKNPTEYTPESIVDKFNRDGYILEAPAFLDMKDDHTRTAEIRLQDHTTLTEYEALQDLDNYLLAAQALPLGDADVLVTDLRHNTTFMGDREIETALDGMAEHVRHIINSSDKQVFVPVDIVAETTTERIDKDKGVPIKSGPYIFDRLLARFSIEEQQSFKERLITRAEDITAKSPEEIITLLIDDCVISGDQLVTSAEELMAEYPVLESTFEALLITANKDRIKDGLHGDIIDIPVKAFYAANDAKHAIYGSRITLPHTPVDYDFSDTLRTIKNAATRNLETGEADVRRIDTKAYQRLKTLPRLVWVERPYRVPNFKLARLDSFRDIQA